MRWHEMQLSHDIKCIGVVEQNAMVQNAVASSYYYTGAVVQNTMVRNGFGRNRMLCIADT